MKLRKMFKWEQKLKDKIDLSKRFPEYIHKSIFQGAFLLIAVLGFVSLAQNNFSPFVVQNYCPEGYTNEFGSPLCVNPFYQCNGLVEAACKHECDRVLCNQEYLSWGEGYKAPWLIRNFNTLFWWILGLAVMINHIEWMRKGYGKV